MDISASLVKTLRERTGAGMMDCKKALEAVSGDLEAAIDWLRKKGLAAASKKAGRVAAEGLVGLASEGSQGVVVEVNAETDFVGRNPEFQAFVQNIAQIALKQQISIENMLEANYHASGKVQEELNRLISVIGENMQLRRIQRLSVSQGIVAAYVHGSVAPNLGRIGVLVALESSASQEPLLDLGKKLAMHIAAANPQALSIEDVDSVALERERSVLRDQAQGSGRPEDVIQKMVEGRIRKYYEEIVLLEQTYVIDNKTKISDLLAEKSKELGTPVKLASFVRWSLGEGIEKEETDFAAEVQAQASRT